MLEAYNKQKEEGVNKILNEVIELNTDKRGESENIKKGLIEYAVKEYRENNTPLRKIAESIEKKFNYPTNHITVRNWIKSAVIEVKT